MGESGLNSERDIINRFQELKQELNALSSKFNDIDNQAQEHDSVIKALTPLDSNRKCFRLIGGVLVERTVAEVLPAVKGNGEQIRMIATSLEKQTRAKEKELVEFQEKYKIRMKGEGDEDAAASKKASSKDRKEGSGVLVSKQ
ncbi:TPA: hypothetical protein ACH3X2_011631 [Trebouxia sp. C0005]